MPAAIGIGIVVWGLLFILSAAVLLHRLRWPRFPLLLLWLIPLVGAVASVPVMWIALERAGRNRWLATVAFIVVLNPLVFFWLAYSDWPDDGLGTESAATSPGTADAKATQAPTVVHGRAALSAEQRALASIRGYLRAGHSLEALRQAGWQDWISHFETDGINLTSEQPPSERDARKV